MPSRADAPGLACAPARPRPRGDRDEREVWYGWQLRVRPEPPRTHALWIADGATLAVATTVGLRTKNVGDGLAVAALGFLGPPVLIHALNDPDVGIPAT